MSTELNRYAADQPVVLASDLFMAETILDSPRAVDEVTVVPGPGEGTIRRLDNTVVGEDWARVRDPSFGADSQVSRTALYGFKGGVGRSTATFMLAKHLVSRGHCVLVVDLDLESPGSGPMLVSEDRVPQYGLVDYLVESALGNEDGLDLVSRASHVLPSGNGELWVAPARGRGTNTMDYSYIDKLNRVYTAAPGADFASRLEGAVRACEDAVARRSRTPDVVLLDSRAGLHDLAAVTVSRLCDLALLFGSDNRQTWTGYRDLFQAWQASGQAQAIREKLRMVASMVPDVTTRADYLESFRENAWSCFSVLYDDLPDGDAAGFNPSPEDDAAPHSPIPILFTVQLVGLDAAATPGWDDLELVQAAYRTFLRTASLLITEGRG
ncbi:KGGVGR-motif variant AAA ATPase [Nocardia abscessus]|uniref:KGGVGR-motif variant AAA ATPase n=1 Tax=Nocardia abscessus TaxID=120957 RepID=UPI001C3F1737|nr:AAA family ATPase [Nocardia abscessus]MCC3326102.1 ParA family protein [Nocardia abscessus]